MRDYSRRRDFLKTSLTALTGACLATQTSLNLSLAQAAVNSRSFSDYRALVLVFLHGGNDSFNMLIPTESAAYQQYQNSRSGLAYNLSDTIPLAGTDYALPSVMSDMQALFNGRRLAMVTNMGTLLEPVTKAQIQADKRLRPGNLFSHNNQQNQWQRLNTVKSDPSGWAGRMSDLLHDSNNVMPVNYNVNRTNKLQEGRVTQGYSIGTGGPETYWGLNDGYSSNLYRHRIFHEMVGTPSHIMEKEFYNKRLRTTTIGDSLRDAFVNAPVPTTVYPEGNSLAAQLATIAKIISIQSQLGQQRQIFYVNLGGWDTHDNQISAHPRLLSSLSEALGAFYRHMDEIGMSNQVTAATLSEFGRTLTQNNDGTDHGWGGHQMVMGGAVNGGTLYGTMPSLELGSDDDFGKGRMIPTTSVEQYVAPLARWMGLTASETAEIFPRLANFDQSTMQYFS